MPAPLVKDAASVTTRRLQDADGLQPGRVKTLRSHHTGTKAKSSAKLTPKLDLAPEPVNYLRLRRTEISKAAVKRNRLAIVAVATAVSTAHEILAPSSPSPKRAKPAPVHSPALDVPETIVPTLPHPNNGREAAEMTATLELHAQRLRDEQTHAAQEQERADADLQALLASLRRSAHGVAGARLSPLFHVYARHKIRSRWAHWRKYTAWHRAESARLAVLAPFAIRIQREFRTRRARLVAPRARLALAWAQWQSAIIIQRLARQWLFRQLAARRALVKHAVRLQAAWRGRAARRDVKRDLQGEVRGLLMVIAPNGALFRLPEVAARNGKLAAKLNAAMTLVAETHVAIDARAGVKSSRYRPRYAAIAAQTAARPVEATRAQLIHSIHELRGAVRERAQELEDAKTQFAVKKRAKAERREELALAEKRQCLDAAAERLAQARETDAMTRAERETREFMRAMKTVDGDAKYRAIVRAQRRECGENERMAREEAVTRATYAALARFEADQQAKQRELERNQRLKQAREDTERQATREKIDEAARKAEELAAARRDREQRVKEQWAIQSAEVTMAAERRQRERVEAMEAADAALQAEREARIAAALEEATRLDRQRAIKHAELEAEKRARDGMGEADRASRAVHCALKKAARAEDWRAKREQERAKMKMDPLGYEQYRTRLEAEEELRRESYSMKLEDARSAELRQQELRAIAREEKRARAQQRAIESHQESQEVVLMMLEEARERAIMSDQQRADEYRKALEAMQTASKRVARKQHEQLEEARNRKLMHDEELSQQRVERSWKLAALARETREREAMSAEDVYSVRAQAEHERLEDKRERERRAMRMMREDVESMARQDWERDGARLEKLLWSPQEAAALRQLISDHARFLHINVQIFVDLTDAANGQLSPLDVDFDVADEYRSREPTMTDADVPERKRKPRKFFYHEFFEDDPIMTKLRHREPKPEDIDILARSSQAKTKARERWQLLVRHYLTDDDSGSAHFTRRGVALMADGHLSTANEAFESAVECYRQRNANVPPALERQIARCRMAQFKSSGDHLFLDGAMRGFQRASVHVWLLSNPRFLQELAFALEAHGQYREAAETLAGIIRGFPRYNQLAEVIFRAAVVLFALHIFRQSREYWMHVMDDSPFGWKSADILFMVARALHREGKPSRKLCAIAYEEAYLKSSSGLFDNFRARSAGWQECLRAPAPWRALSDQYSARGEYVLAKDALHMMTKRQLQKRSQLAVKRQAVIAARRRQQRHDDGGGEEISEDKDSPVDRDDGDWLRLACTYAMLRDCSFAATAMAKWLEDDCYENRVRQRFYRWPLVRWKLLTGRSAPPKVVQWIDDQRRALLEQEKAKRAERDAQRQLARQQRQLRTQQVMEAWGDLSEPTAPTTYQREVLTETLVIEDDLKLEAAELPPTSQ